MEREIRAVKRELSGLDVGIKETNKQELKNSLQAEFNANSVKLKQQEAKMRDFLKQTGRFEENARTQVIGFGRSTAQKAVWANKRGLQMQLERDIIKDIKECGIVGEVNINPTAIDLSNFTFDNAHINKARKHNVTRDEAESFVRNAKFAVARWNGRYRNYYAEAGAAFLDMQENNIRTSFNSDDFTPPIINALEVLKKHGR